MRRKHFLNSIKNAPSCIINASEESDFRVFCNADGDGPVELLIMEEIGENWYGEGVKATEVVGFLNDHQDREISVRINSPGGLVYDGFVIYNALANHPEKVTVTIEGLAFSAASYIAMSGDVVMMHKASDFGVHRSATAVWGNAKEMRAAIEWLDTIDGHLLEIYQDRTGATANQINKWLDGTSDGTLFSAADALKHGFVDEVIEPKKKKNTAKARDVVKDQGIAMAKRSSARNRLKLLSLKG